MFDQLVQNEKRLHNVLPNDVINLERAMFDYITSNELDLYSMIAFQMGWKDKFGELEQYMLPKRFIGQIVISVARSIEFNENTIAKSVAMELLCNFLMVHGDVQTGNTERNERASLWWEWGPAQAVNTGDAINALARLALIRGLKQSNTPLVGDLQIFDESTLYICKGLYNEIEYQEGLFVTVENYLNMLRQSRGTLIACAMAMGGSESKVPIDLKLLIKYGEMVGIARGIQHDIDTVWSATDQQMKGHLAIKKKTLPVIYVFNSNNASAKRALGELYMQRVISPDKVGDIAQIAEECGAREYCTNQLQNHIQMAKDTLAAVGLNDEAQASIFKLMKEIIDEPWTI